MIHRAFRYKLEPTTEQAETLAQFAGTARFVYNLALSQRNDFWRQHRSATGRSINYVSQSREVTQLRAQVDWIRAVPTTALTQALRDLDKAFANFWSGRARFPMPRRKGVNDSFRCQGSEMGRRDINGRWSGVRVPNLGWIKYRDTRPLAGRMLSATISLTADGWFISFACEIEHEAQPSQLPAVGIDRGIANTIALSTGELLSTPAITNLDRQKKRAQRVLARRRRGSNRHCKQRKRLGRITAKIARVRAAWRHKAALGIAQRFGAVVIEDLRIPNMVKANRGLSRSIHEQGWGAFERVLIYKLEERGGTLVKINPAFTSQECSACGTIDKASRESQASYACRHCGYTGHADTNAALVILRRSTASMRAEGSGYAPDETRTVSHALAA